MRRQALVTATALFALLAAGSVLAQTARSASNLAAANGPFPGDLGVIDQEWECSQKRVTPGYFMSLNGAEVADSERSQLYPCASFLGSMTGQNRVFAWRSQEEYQGVLFINNRNSGELYLTGGNNPPATGIVPPGPFVAKVDATTGKGFGELIWRMPMCRAPGLGRRTSTSCPTVASRSLSETSL
jgi:hypothetical protein